MAIFTDPKHVEEMTSYMKQQNFSPGYVAQHVQVFQFIIKRISLYNWQNYDDVRKWVSSQNYMLASHFFPTQNLKMLPDH